MTQTRQTVELLTAATAGPQAADVFSKVVRLPDGSLPNLYAVLAHSPDVFEKFIDFGYPLLFSSVLDRALSELVIMRVTCLLNAEYEWYPHWQLGQAAGVDAGQAAQIGQWQKDETLTELQRDALQLADELTLNGTVNSDIVKRLRERLRDRAVVELVTQVAMFNGYCRISNALVPTDTLEEGVPPVPVADRSLIGGN
jgi:alkylhydroperoxidase family enzyme